MPEPLTIAARVLDALVEASLVTADQVASARADADDVGKAGRALVDRGLVRPDQLAHALEIEMGFPRVDLASYAPDDEALEIVPSAVAHARAILPLFEIEGTLTVAIGDPADVFILDEVGIELGVTMDAVLADPDAVSAAIEQYFPAKAGPAEAPTTVPELGAEEIEISVGDFFELEDQTPMVISAPGGEEPTTEETIAQTVEQVVEATAPAGTPTVDLDVLAVADERKVAVLVSDILDQAVARGANRIHLLPYKTDFFLVFRIKGRLEKIASAPLSMQPPLIEGFKSYAKLGGAASSRPALGRTHADIGGKPVVLTVSSVPTLSGQRLVVIIAPAKPQPKELLELGMAEAESRALDAMVERGRGILLVAAPVSGGRSTTYYALLSHAAQVGKTVYSVERSVEYEIPAVAQVLVSPGEPISASGYFAAGMRQDTDVMAIDSLQTVEDVHLAIEAAGMGKLVIVTFAGGDIVSAVRRMLDLGAEPVSLSSALTLGIGQRVVRTNCPNCSVEERSPLASRIPGAEDGMSTRRGTGCPNCAKSGFAGATGIFEVLPFTEPVRAVIGRGGSAADIEAAARAAGMRSMVASGLAKVKDGSVSPEELDRVLRFAQ
jgi:type IV pilus assembly protein PilB